MGGVPAVTDPLGAFYQHATTLRRMTTGGPRGSGLAPEEHPIGYVEGGTKMVRNQSGDEVVSTLQIAYPASVGYIAPLSTITVPAEFGLSPRVVISCSVGKDPGVGLPAHVEVACE